MLLLQIPYARNATRRRRGLAKNGAPRGRAVESAAAQYDAAELAEAEAEAEAAIAAALAELQPDPAAENGPDTACRPPKATVMSYCHHCGAKLISERPKYCNSCGNSLDKVATS